MENDILIQLLACLAEHPNMYSLITQSDADDIDDLGYWNWSDGQLSIMGLECLKTLMGESGTLAYLNVSVVERLGA